MNENSDVSFDCDRDETAHVAVNKDDSHDTRILNSVQMCAAPSMFDSLGVVAGWRTARETD